MAAAGTAAPDAVDRLNQAVTSSRLWLPECAAQQPPLPTAVPTTFTSPQEYLATFTPLLLEEAVESVRASYEECEKKGKGATVTLTQCQEQPDGWRKLTLRPATPADKQALMQLQRDKDAGVVVLTLHQQQGNKHQQQQQGSVDAGGVVRVTGLVLRWEVDKQDLVLVRVRPWCGGHEWMHTDAPCCKVYPILRSSSSSSSSAAPTTWQLTLAGSTVTAQRELNSLKRLQNISLLPYLLNPAAAATAATAVAVQPQQQDEGAAAAAAAGEGGAGGAGGAAGGVDSNSSSRYTLPDEVAGSAFVTHLEQKFDRPQADAILKCAAHVHLLRMSMTPQPPAAGNNKSNNNGIASSSNGSSGRGGSSDGGGGSGGGASGSNGGSSGSSGSSPPVSLIQGPPGTGKTYTVLGVLNLWHMVLYHRHYASLDAVVRRLVEGGGSDGPGMRIDRVLLSDGFKAQLAPRPRILVCAPSNAATDELLERVMRGGFIDKNGNKYNPNMIRLGSEEALSSAAQEVWVEQLAGRLLALDPRAFHAELQALQQDERNLITALANCGESVAAMRTLVTEAQAAAAASPDDPHLLFASNKQAENLQQVLAKLVGYFERLRVVKVELRRRSIVQDTVVGAGAQQWAMRMQNLRRGLQQQQQQQGQQQQQQQQLQQQRDEWRQAFRMCPRDLQQQLEVSFIEDAEMVFTTLSSSGREVFSRLAVPFPLVLLDEAGQATEVASLQPLVYGARGVVMVGDPQQLPATIFSQAGKQLALERSLFERLAAGGCPVSMLRVQYRMHPAIRTFPSAFFYSNALIDADSVLLRQGAWYLNCSNTPAAAAAGAAGAGVHANGGGGVGGGGGGMSGAAAAGGGGGAHRQGPADPRRRSPTPEAAAAAAAAAEAAAVAAAAGSSDGSNTTTSSSSFLLPYGVFDVAGGCEHSVGRSKANAAEADLAVELYSQLRGALSLQEAATAAEAAAKQELMLAQPTNVGIVTPYRGQRDLIREKLSTLFGPHELSRVRVETIDSFQGKQLDVVILSLVRASSSSSSNQHFSAHNTTAAAAAGAATAGAGAASGGGGGGGAAVWDVAAGGAGDGGGGDGSSNARKMLPLNRTAGVGFLSDVRRMNVAITRARLACLILGRVDTLRQDAAWSALVSDAAARECLFQVPSVAALQQQHKAGRHQQQHHKQLQQQQLLSLIAAAREKQELLVMQLRTQRQLRLPTPPPPPVMQVQPPPPPPLQQQQRQPTPPLSGGLPPGLQHHHQHHHQQHHHQQHHQHHQQQQQGAPEFGRPAKQQKLDPAVVGALQGVAGFLQQQQGGAGAGGVSQPLQQQQQKPPLAPGAASGLAAAAAARGLPINTAAAAAAGAAAAGGGAPQGPVNPAAAAVERVAAEAGRGSAAVYQGMQPDQAVVAWGLWPHVVELQQRILEQRQQKQ